LPHAAATLARQLSATVQRKVRREFSKKHLATIRPSALKYRHAARRPCQNRLFPPRLGEGDQPGINSWFGPQYEFSSKAFLLNELGISTQTKQRSMSSRCKTAAVFAANAVAAAWLTCGAAFAGDSPANKAVLAEADTILGQMQASRYSHKTEVDAGKGIFNVDCSGLVRLILKRAAPASLAQIVPEKEYPQPRAVAFYNAFLGAPEQLPAVGWQRIKCIASCEPGDFIAWRKSVIPAKGTSGHVLIVREKPVREDDGSFRVKVLDSCSTPHAMDSRPKGASGIGTGTMWFTVNDNGELVAFRWSDKKKTPTRLKIAIGRAIR